MMWTKLLLIMMLLAGLYGCTDTVKANWQIVWALDAAHNPKHYYSVEKPKWEAGRVTFVDARTGQEVTLSGSIIVEPYVQ